MYSLRTRLIAIVIAAVTPVVAVLVFNEHSQRRARMMEVEQTALSTAKLLGQEIERVFISAEGLLRSLSAAPSVRSFDIELCEPYLQQVARQIAQYTAISVIDLQGKAVCRSDLRPVDVSLSDRSYFRQALARPGAFVIGEYTLSRVTNEAVLPLAMAVLGQDGKPVGVLAVGLSMDWLGAQLRDRPRAANGSLTVADRNGVILAREPLAERFVGTRIPDTFQSMVKAAAPGTRRITSQDGTERILGYIPADLPPTGIYISAGISAEEAFAPLNAALARSVAVTMSALALSVLGASYLARSLITGPLHQLAETIEARRGGNLAARAATGGGGEIRNIGVALDRYLDELDAAVRERDDAERHRDLLTKELAHRIKNLIATIMSIARQTLRPPEVAPAKLADFQDRLMGLAEAQKLLLIDAAHPVTIATAIRTSTSLFEGRDRTFDVSGKEFTVGGKAALSLAMAVHELCTNAVKYGALSRSSGRVFIGWEINNAKLSLLWKERGGPAVTEPTKKGFGTKMIEQILTAELGGVAEFRYPPEGLEFLLTVPLAGITPR